MPKNEVWYDDDPRYLDAVAENAAYLTRYNLQIPTTHKYQQFMEKDYVSPMGLNLTEQSLKPVFRVPPVAYAIAMGIFLVLGGVWVHEADTDRRNAQRAYEDQKAKTAETRVNSWQAGFMVGSQSSLDAMTAAWANLGTLTTNAPEFVRSNIIWTFNLQRPK